MDWSLLIGPASSPRQALPLCLLNSPQELPLFHKVANSVLNPVFPEFTLLVLQFSAYLFPPPGALGV